MAPALQKIDHIHVHVSRRAEAEAWYREVLGLQRVVELESWAVDGGPLTLADASGAIHLALFERPVGKNHATIALAVDAPSFIAWRQHLEKHLGTAPELEDHGLSWSIYFRDPDGNPFEITSYEHTELQRRLKIVEG